MPDKESGENPFIGTLEERYGAAGAVEPSLTLDEFREHEQAQLTQWRID
jgi:hypothetical protein